MLTRLQKVLRDRYLHPLGHEKQPWSALHENVMNTLLPGPIIEDRKNFETEKFNPKPVCDMGRGMDRAIDRVDNGSRG